MYKYSYSKNIKIKCPQCGQKTFVPVVETGTRNIFNERVGKCDRAVNCGYRYDIQDYKNDNGEIYTPEIIEEYKQPPKPLAYIPTSIMTATLKGYDSNTFVKYLNTLFCPDIVSDLISKYYIGTSNSRFDGGCIFWFVDVLGRVKAGQIKRFKPDGHTDSYYSKKKESFTKCTCNIHTALKYKIEKDNRPLPEWLQTYIDRGEYFTTLYGEHLLNIDSNKNKTVALVEAPKTAIIASVYYPDFVWVATTALDYFTETRISVLEGRDVVLFPDLGAFEKWDNRGKVYKHIANFSTCDILERIATDKDRENGLDIADYLARVNISEFMKADFMDSAIAKGMPLTHDEQVNLCLSYIKKGLTVKDLELALNELVDAHGFYFGEMKYRAMKERKNIIAA